MDRNESSINQIWKCYGISKTTILQHYHKKNTTVNGTKYFCHSLSLSKVIESELRNYILLLKERMFGLTPITEIRQLSFDVAEELKVKYQFQNGITDKKWYYNFIQCNLDLSLQTSKFTPMAWLKGFSIFM